jgi:hypothetical protein
MESRPQAVKELRKLLRKAKAVDLEALFGACQTRSRMTVFRRLRKLGYLSSFTHGGRYYTLLDIPSFDQRGLWFHGDVGFSRHGTLKQTVAVLVEQAPEGHSHRELESLLRVRVHNTLLELVRQRRIGRERFERSYLYVSADADRAAEQLTGRRELEALLAELHRVLTDEEIIEVLVEALRAAPMIPEPQIVSQRLRARGIALEPRLVQQVYEMHALVPEKKTAPPSSPRSRR